jgi:hypothetical protein
MHAIRSIDRREPHADRAAAQLVRTTLDRRATVPRDCIIIDRRMVVFIILFSLYL